MSNLSRKWMELTTKKMVKPAYVDSPAVMENVLTGDKVDINMFPSPWFYPDDGGRFFVTAGFLVTKDPDTGWTNLGTYRAQVLGKDILGSQIIKGKHGDMHMKKDQEAGQPAPRRADDVDVVVGRGEEITVAFDAEEPPPLPPGWRRDFLLYSDSWLKDADLNTATGQGTAPLPFHGMSRYPYGADERYPTDAAHQRYVKRYDTRRMTPRGPGTP